MENIIRSARYDYFWNSEKRSIGIFVDAENQVTAYRLVFPGGSLGENLGTYSWDGDMLSGSGSLTANQKEQLELLLKVNTDPFGG